MMTAITKRVLLGVPWPHCGMMDASGFRTDPSTNRRMQGGLYRLVNGIRWKFFRPCPRWFAYSDEAGKRLLRLLLAGRIRIWR
jgi:hypothetical protein